jgi:anti-sigma regulatory factor (Ser/Thr protein kinase)
VELPALPESVRRARHVVLDALRDVAVDRDAVAVVVSEAMTDALVHGSRAPLEGGTIRLSATVDADFVEIEVGDEGARMRPGPDRPAAALGLPIMAALADDVEVGDGPAARLCARFALFGPAGPHGRRVPRMVR